MGASKNFWWLGFDSQGGLLTTHVDDNAAKLLYGTLFIQFLFSVKIECQISIEGV